MNGPLHSCRLGSADTARAAVPWVGDAARRGRTTRFSVAPMLDWTDRHYRFFARLLTSRALLYTEMVTANACIRGDREYLLGFDESEHPIAVQLGGDDPAALAEAARIATDFGYDEINLNVGCPSERVQHGSFGACLMAEPDLVARIVEAIRDVTNLPVTVKHRIGIRGFDRYEDLRRFVDVVSEAGPSRFTVHARIAVLEGLSPKENRTIPPLRYEDVYRLKRERPDLSVEINGGIRTVEDACRHLECVDAVMVGRAAYENPVVLAHLDSTLAPGTETPAVVPRSSAGRSATDRPAAPHAVTRRRVIEGMAEYARRRRQEGTAPRHIFRHMLHLFAGKPGSRRYRQVLSGRIAADADPAAVLRRATERVPPEVLEEPLAWRCGRATVACRRG